MPPLTSHHPASRRGFTLIELLVATSILTLVIVLVSSLMHNATLTITSNTGSLDSDAQAREFLNRLGRDLSSMIIRPDVDYTTFKNALYPDTGATEQKGTNGANDWFAFYAENQGYFSTSITPDAIAPYALIGYDGVDDDLLNKGPVIQRLTKGIGWADNGGSWANLLFNKDLRVNFNPSDGYTLFSATPSDYPAFVKGSTRDPDFQTVGDQIFRFEYMYLLKKRLLEDGTTILPQKLSVVPFHEIAGVTGSINGFKDVDAIIVAIAVLDTKSREQVNNFSQLVDSLPDAVDGADIESQWMRQITAPAYNGVAGIPEAVASNIRVYQRYYYLNTK